MVLAASYQQVKTSARGGKVMGIGIKLIKLMEERNLNPNKLAKISDVPAVTIYSIVRRDPIEIKNDTLEKIAHALNVSVNYFSEEVPLEGRTIIARHDDEDWTEDELAEIERFKDFLKSKRKPSYKAVQGD